jgi:cellulose biosynthesis protein BcsQ
MPQPPYVLLFEEVVPGARPLTILVDDRGAVPLFDSEEKASEFVASTDFGAGLEPVEVSGAGLVRALESVGDEVDYVAIDPPPSSEGPMRVRMGGLKELVEALQQSQEDDLFGLGRGLS